MKIAENSSRTKIALAAAVVVYFIFFRDDLIYLLGLAEEVLQLTNAISPWFYLLIAVGLICWTAVKLWGGTRKGSRVASK